MRRKQFLSLLLVLCMLASLLTVSAAAEGNETVHTLVLSSSENEDGSWSHTATYDGKQVVEYDYTWNIDPSEVHDEVKNVPGAYYTGTEPTGEESVYIAHDIYYYPELPEDGFVRQRYDDDTEWCYYYTAEGYTDYVFSTLPVSGNSVPTQMMHSAEEAFGNAVLHITEAGTYSITGNWHGQIWIDLGDDAFDDPTARVTVILNGVDVTCTVAASLVFANVYECDNTWEDQESWTENVDTSEAGANVVLADGTVNNFSGTNIYRILKTKFKSDDAEPHTGAAQKKYLKIDGAFYSYMTMNINGQTEGTGVLNITAGFEGLDTELHLTINGGNVNISSQDDGINVNEDGVSVVTINGGSVHIVSGLGAEGDGIDSNGFLVINGGTVISCANPGSDSGLDSDMGSFVNGGYVVATGSTMDWAESDSDQVTMNLQFTSSQDSDEAVIVTDLEGNVIFAYDPDKDETTGSYNRGYKGAVISSPEFQVGESYYVYVGGDVEGTDVNGLYDITTVTGYSDDAVQQCYTGTSVGFGGFGGGMPDFGAMPDFGGGMPDFGGGMPDFGGAPDFGGFVPNAGPGGRPGMGGSSSSAVVSCIFYMTDKVNAFSGVTDFVGSTGFTDVSENDSFAEAVAWAVDNGIIVGTGDGTTFSPYDGCTRAQFITFLWRAAGCPTSQSGLNIFTDVQSGSYYYDAVLWAIESGLSTGEVTTSFNPDQVCTLEEIVALMLSNPDVSITAEDAMAWAMAKGIDYTSFDLSTGCTRAMAAEILYFVFG